MSKGSCLTLKSTFLLIKYLKTLIIILECHMYEFEIGISPHERSNSRDTKTRWQNATHISFTVHINFDYVAYSIRNSTPLCGTVQCNVMQCIRALFWVVGVKRFCNQDSIFSLGCVRVCIVYRCVFVHAEDPFMWIMFHILWNCNVLSSAAMEIMNQNQNNNLSFSPNAPPKMCRIIIIITNAVVKWKWFVCFTSP